MFRDGPKVAYTKGHFVILPARGLAQSRGGWPLADGYNVTGGQYFDASRAASAGAAEKSGHGTCSGPGCEEVGKARLWLRGPAYIHYKVLDVDPSVYVPLSWDKADGSQSQFWAHKDHFAPVGGHAASKNPTLALAPVGVYFNVRICVRACVCACVRPPTRDLFS